MSRWIRGARLRIAIAGIALLAVASASAPAVLANPAEASAPGLGTPLPAGWELCILQGVGAPGTPENVADLDEWQTAEGGSTNNAAAYNPFNVRRATDVNGAALPLMPARGVFPAFQTWAAGCAATVATLLEPSMAPIVRALQVGTLSPPGVFLGAVDETPWCAPSADGVPCYANQVLAGAVVRLALTGRSTQMSALLTAYSGFDAELHTYEQASFVVSVDSRTLAGQNAQLQAAEQQFSTANRTLANARGALQQLAIDNYTTDGALRFNQDFTLVDTPDEQDTIGQYFQGLAASMAVARYDRAKAAAEAAASERQTAEAEAQQAAADVSAASSAKEQALSALEGDVRTFETSLSCAPTPATAPATQIAIPTNAGQVWGELQGCLSPPAAPAPSATPTP
jgi:hypothetical protein